MAYLTAYEEWERNMDGATRELLAGSVARGVAAPDLEDLQTRPGKRIVLGLAGDAAERAAVAAPDMGALLDGCADVLQERWGVSPGAAVEIAAWMDARVEREAEERKAMVVARMVGLFVNASNAKMLSASLAYAAGLALPYGLGSMEEWATSNGVTRQAVSKQAKKWRKELGLAPGEHGRSEELCQKYSEAQKNGHWRRTLPGTGSDGE